MITGGIDEAGRGPVVGPMVMAICGLSKETGEQLLRAGIKDSKLILPVIRIMLAELIREKADFIEIVEFSPHEIDDAVNDPKMNLNRLEAKGTALLLSAFWNKHPTSRVAVDLPSNNMESYKSSVVSFLPEEHKEKASLILLEHKADANYVEAGCASILAKTIRDARIQDIERKLGFPIGSGYPSDPKTIIFIKSLNSIGEKHVRKSWESYKRLYKGKGQTKLR
ncbi:MAG: ribonuclease HII [Candidatus Woesearchaeota archaeon]